MKYDLVFEGGGAKGMVLVGALQEFSARGNTGGRLLGTSAGAITAALLAAGYSAEEMLAALNERENGHPIFAAFMGQPAPFTPEEITKSAINAALHDINFTFIPQGLEEKLYSQLSSTLANDPKFRHFFAFVERGGWYAADRFVTWLQTKLDSGLWQGKPRHFSHMTLAEFFAATKVDLSLVASDTHGSQILVLNHRTAPQCPLVWAVRMSMSIPLVWNEVIWAAAWGPYQGRNITGHAIVDGGMLSNFPIELFISDAPQVTKLMGPKQDNPVLGMLIDEATAVPMPRGLLVQVNINPMELQTVQRLLRLVNTMTTAHDKMVIDEFSHLVVRLPAGGYGTTEFDMSDARREALVDAGRQAMRAYLDRLPESTSAPRGPAEDAAARAQRLADQVALRVLGE